MRIVDEFNVLPYKCTLFFHNSKYTLQVEDANYLVQFKLGNQEAEKVQNMKPGLENRKMKYHLDKTFSMMHDSRIVLDSLQEGDPGDALPEII